MANALIGYSGFVGSTLLRQARFERLFRSTNIGDMAGGSFDTVVCAGAPAQKWIANREPEADRKTIDGLIGSLGTMTCKRLILISTVDVFRNPNGVDEETPVEASGLGPYGLHRRLLEEFVECAFPDRLIVRLPGLVGPGLRKNVIFDLLNDNNLAAVNCRSVFQFYPMVNLWFDIQTALKFELRLVHLTAEPISVAEASLQGFGRPFELALAEPAARYDMQTQHAAQFGASGRYQYAARETIQAIRAYAQSEPTARKSAQGTAA
jgi:hypothetical protein